MTDNVVTRIRLPSQVHRQVKAAAAYHDVNLDEALGLCVARLVSLEQPLSWLLDTKPLEPDVVAPPKAKARRK